MVALGLLGEPTAVRILRPATTDRDPLVRLEAAEGLWRLGQGDDIAVERSRNVLGNCVRRPDLSHHRQLVAIELPRQVRADCLPVVAPVVALKQNVGSEVDPRSRVRADDQG